MSIQEHPDDEKAAEGGGEGLMYVNKGITKVKSETNITFATYSYLPQMFCSAMIATSNEFTYKSS